MKYMLKHVAVLCILLAALASFFGDKKFYNTDIPLWIVNVVTAFIVLISWPKQSRVNNTRNTPKPPAPG